MKNIVYSFCCFVIFLAQAEEIEAISLPSADVTLSFVRSGLIVDVPVKAGDHVKEGQLLAQLESSLERNRIEQLVQEIANDTKAEAERITLAQKKIDYVELKKAHEQGAGTKKESDHAALDVSKSEYTLKQLAFEKKQLKKKLEEAKLLLQQTQVHSPLTGFVETVFSEKGEAIQGLTELMRIVQVKPLWVDVPVPINLAKKMSDNKNLELHFPAFASYPAEVMQAKIIFKASIADAGSETVLYRLEVANEKARPAGERVKLLLK